jgi:nucleoside 2-deoxyribosyltransferase
MFKVINPADKETKKVGDPAYELFINKPDRVIFLAGPCPRKNYEEDWRNEAVEYLEKAGFDGIIFNPTNPYYDASDPLYLEKQTEWEQKAIHMSDRVVFWIPRTEEHPALTTNIELGEFLVKEKIDKILIGMPDYAIKNNYIKIRLKMLNKYYDTDLKTLMYRVVEALK